MMKFAEVMMEMNLNWFFANELAIFVQEEASVSTSANELQSHGYYISWTTTLGFHPDRNTLTSWNYMDEYRYRQGSTLRQVDEHISRDEHIASPVRKWTAQSIGVLEAQTAHHLAQQWTESISRCRLIADRHCCRLLASAMTSQGPSSSSSGHAIERSPEFVNGIVKNDYSASTRTTLAGEEETVRSVFSATAADKVEAVVDDIKLHSTQNINTGIAGDDNDDDTVDEDASMERMTQ